MGFGVTGSKDTAPCRTREGAREGTSREIRGQRWWVGLRALCLRRLGGEDDGGEAGLKLPGSTQRLRADAVSRLG